MSPWPESLPTAPLYDRQFSETQDDNRVVFKIDNYPPKMRRRTTARTYTMPIALILTLDQRKVLKRFFEEITIDGTQPFEFTDPIEGDVHHFSFETMIKYTPLKTVDLGSGITPGHYEASFVLRRLP